MKILKRSLAVLAILAALLAGTWFWYLYAPAPKQPALAGSLEQFTITSGGIERSLNVYVPAGAEAGDKKRPLVFVFHGSMGTAERVRQSPAYEFDLLADQHDFLVVYPQGYKNHWNDCRGTADYAANTENIDDIGFVRDMLDLLDNEYGIERRQVFATGHSNGGQMAYKLALEAPELVAAIAPISASLPDAAHLDCNQRGVALPVAIFNGTEDPVNPYQGGLVRVFGNSSRGVVLSSADTAAYWARLAGAAAPVKIEHPQIDGNDSTSIIEQRWTNNSGLQVRLYTLQGSGHVIPTLLRRYPRALGGDARDMSGPAEIIDFFLGQS